MRPITANATSGSDRRSECESRERLAYFDCLTCCRVGQAAFRRAGPPNIFSGLSGGPALEASLSHPTSSQVRQSNYDSATLSQPEVFLDELDDVAEEDVAEAALSAVDLCSDFGPDATHWQTIFVDIDADVDHGLVFAG